MNKHEVYFQFFSLVYFTQSKIDLFSHFNISEIHDVLQLFHSVLLLIHKITMHLIISGILDLMKCGINADEYPAWIDLHISCNGLCFSHHSLSLSVIATLLDFVRFLPT